MSPFFWHASGIKNVLFIFSLSYTYYFGRQQSESHYTRKAAKTVYQFIGFDSDVITQGRSKTMWSTWTFVHTSLNTNDVLLSQIPILWLFHCVYLNPHFTFKVRFITMRVLTTAPNAFYVVLCKVIVLPYAVCCLGLLPHEINVTKFWR